MHRARFVFGCCIALLGVSLRADPADEVTAAVQHFLAQPNYSWVVTHPRGIPENGGVLASEETEGQHEKDGYTKIHFLAGPHISRREPATRTWPAITDDPAYVSVWWVFETPDGWKAFVELVDSLGSFPPSPRVRKRPPPSPLHINIAFGAWRPDLELEIIIAQMHAVTKPADDRYEVTLTKEGAVKLFYPNLDHRIQAASMPRRDLRGIAANVRIWTRRNTVIRYDLTFDVNLPARDGTQLHRLFRAREIKDVGSTVIEVPEEAKRKLQR